MLTILLSINGDKMFNLFLNFKVLNNLFTCTTNTNQLVLACKFSGLLVF